MRKLLVPLAVTIATACIPFAVSASSSPCDTTWNVDLKSGTVSSDVFRLQQFLNQDAVTQIARSGAGSPGMETTRFGALTRAGVVRFQEKYASDILTPNGLTKGTGVVGSATRAKLNALCAAPAATLPAADDSLTLDTTDMPAASLAAAGTGTLFAAFTLTAGSRDVLVNNITVERIGPASDGAFDSIALFDGQGLQVGPIATWNSNHKAVFKKSFTIPAGTTKSFQVYGNIDIDLSNYGGEMAAIQIDAIDASAPIRGTLPAQGNAQTFNSTLATGYALADRSSYDPGVSRTKYINDNDVTFSGIRISATSVEDLSLYSIIWTQDGTAGDTDLANLKTIVNGQAYPIIRSPYSDREYVSLFDPAIKIPKGNSVDVSIQGDILPSAANRTVRFDIRDNTDDISLMGDTYGFGAGIVPGGNTATDGDSVFLTDTGDTDGESLTPFYQGSTVSVLSAGVNYIGR